MVKGNNLEIVKRVTVMQGYERKKLSVNSNKTLMWIHSSWAFIYTSFLIGSKSCLVKDPWQGNRPGVQLCHLWAWWPWANCLISLSFSSSPIKWVFSSLWSQHPAQCARNRCSADLLEKWVQPEEIQTIALVTEVPGRTTKALGHEIFHLKNTSLEMKALKVNTGCLNCYKLIHWVIFTSSLSYYCSIMPLIFI